MNSPELTMAPAPRLNTPAVLSTFFSSMTPSISVSAELSSRVHTRPRLLELSAKEMPAGGENPVLGGSPQSPGRFGLPLLNAELQPVKPPPLLERRRPRAASLGRVGTALA